MAQFLFSMIGMNFKLLFADSKAGAALGGLQSMVA